MNSSEKKNQNKGQSDYYNSIDLAKERRKTSPFNKNHPGNIFFS